MQAENGVRRVANGALLGLCLIVAALAYWAPWIDHRAAALKLCGQDLGEFVKFIPAVSRGEIRFPRQLFYLPPFVCAIGLVLVGMNRHLPFPRLVRGAMLLLALLILPGLLPPVWGHPKELFTPEFRLQGIALLVGLAAVAAHGLWRGLSPVALGATVAVLSLLALLPSQWAFWTIRPYIWAVYDTPTIRLGWGLWVEIIAWMGAFASGLIMYWGAKR